MERVCGNPVSLLSRPCVQQCVTSTYLAIHAFTLATNFPREVAEETILEKYAEGKFHPPTLMTTFGVEHGRTSGRVCKAQGGTEEGNIRRRGGGNV